MSISTQGGDQQRQPSVVSTGKKPTPGAKPAGGDKPKPAAKAARPGGPPRAGGGGGKGPRKPVRPVKVSQGRAWGPIALFAAVGLLCAGIIGYGAWAAYNGSRSWQDRAADIPGIVNYFEKDPALVKQRDHKKGSLEYKVTPPVAGAHSVSWQNCMGNVYDAPIANENAVHSLEHGAVWITYRDDLPADQVAALAAKVSGKEFTMMSPAKGLDKPVSLQAWGYQLKLDGVNDARIDEFIKVLRINATQEPGVGCSGGITATGTTPREVPQQQQQQPQPGS